MAEFGFDLNDIRRLIKLVESRRLQRLVVEEDGRMIEIIGRDPRENRPAHRIAEPEAVDSADMVPEAPFEDDPSVSEETDESRFVVTSPVVGVFYRSPSPDSAPFVEVGDRVEVGQPIGLIEAMKVFSEVTTDYAGVVTDILVEGGRLVKQGEPLLFLRPE